MITSQCHKYVGVIPIIDNHFWRCVPNWLGNDLQSRFMCVQATSPPPFLRKDTHSNLFFVNLTENQKDVGSNPTSQQCE